MINTKLARTVCTAENCIIHSRWPNWNRKQKTKKIENKLIEFEVVANKIIYYVLCDVIFCRLFVLSFVFAVIQSSFVFTFETKGAENIETGGKNKFTIFDAKAMRRKP